jgi:hypothetical protein
MSGDRLDAALQALRRPREGERTDGEATLARIVATVRQGRRRRLRRLAVGLALAAAFVISSAWAASTGHSPWQSVVGFLGLRAVPAPDVPAHDVRGAAPAMPASPEESAPDPPSAATLRLVAPEPMPSVTLPEEAPRTVRKGEATTVSPHPRAAIVASTRPSASAAASDQGHEGTSSEVGARHSVEDDLYERAHRIHFQEGDFARALPEWDGYLSAFPSGRWAPEARYNRAIALIKLGRFREARAALAPIAAGEYGEYRRSEARSLIETIERRTPGTE